MQGQRPSALMLNEILSKFNESTQFDRRTAAIK